MARLKGEKDTLRTVGKIIGLGTACAACCALPLAAPLLAGTFTGSALFSFGADALEWIAGLTALGLVALLLWRFLRAASNRPGTADTRGCGCSSATDLTHAIGKLDLAPIACTLMQGDFKERVEWIQSLARESLREARHEPLALHLRYDAAAAARVREMVRKEEACCAFLRFDVQEDADGVRLTITAPEEAREAANALFASFAPDLHHFQKSSSVTKKEPVQP